MNGPFPHRAERQRPRQRSGFEPEGPPGNELAALLWVIATLLAVLDVFWWLSERWFAA